MSELMGKRLIKFCRRQFKICRCRIVDTVLPATIEYCSGRNHLACRGVEVALKCKADHFRRQTQRSEDRTVGVEHDRTLSTAITRVRIWSCLNAWISHHIEELLGRLDVAAGGKTRAGYTEKPTCVRKCEVSCRDSGPTSEEVVDPANAGGIVDYDGAIGSLT